MRSDRFGYNKPSNKLKRIRIQIRITNALYYVIAGCLLLTTTLYFLVDSGSANSFPTYLLAIAVLLLLALNPIQYLLLDRRITLLAISLLTYLAVSVAWSGTEESIAKHLGYGVLILTFCIAIPVTLTRFRYALYWLLLLTILAAVISCGFTLYLHYTNPDYQPLPEPRLFALGRLNNPVISALSYGFAVMLCAYMVMTRERTIAKIVFAEIALLLIGAIVLTWSRGVWLALGAGLMVGVYLHYPGRRVKPLAIAAGLLALLATVVIAALGWDVLWQRALSFRPEIWSEFIRRTFAENVLIGVGMTTDSSFKLPELMIKHPHSLFVSTFYYGGLTGLGLYFGLLAACFQRIARLESREIRTLAGMLLTYGVTATFLDGDELLTKVNHLWLLIWLPAGLLLLKSPPKDASTTA